jgi:hypothetical protein
MFKAISSVFLQISCPARTYPRSGAASVEKVAFSAKFGEDFPCPFKLQRQHPAAP